MNPSPFTECVYCGNATPRQSAKQRTCPSCYRKMVAEFGLTWFECDWHRALLPEFVKYAHESEKLVQALSIESDRIDFSVDDIREPAVPVPTRNPGVYQAVETLYVIQGLGCRKIKRALDAAGVKPTVSLASVKRYLATVKRERAKQAFAGESV